MYSALNWCFYHVFFFFFSSRRRHTRCLSDWSSDVCSSDLESQSASTRVRCPRFRDRPMRPRATASRRPSAPPARLGSLSCCRRTAAAPSGVQIGRASCREEEEIEVVDGGGVMNTYWSKKDM